MKYGESMVVPQIPSLPKLVPTDVALRILARVKEIADEEGLELGASFGANHSPFGAPLQVTFSVKSDDRRGV